MSAEADRQVAAIMRGAEFGDEATRRTMEGELRERLAEDRPLRVYCGYDPTAVMSIKASCHAYCKHIPPKCTATSSHTMLRKYQTKYIYITFGACILII